MSTKIEAIKRLIDASELEDALSKTEQLLAANQYDLEALTCRAKVYYKQKAYEHAISEYNHLINLLPTNAELIADRGLSYHMLGVYDKALADFNAVIELEPNNPYWYSCRAFIKDYIKDYQGSLIDYEKVLSLDPEDAIALNNKGLVEEKLGYLEKSQVSFKRADQIEGIDLEKEIGHLQIPVEKKPESTQRFSVKYFFKVLSSLFNSPTERSKFISFLIRSKRK